MRRSAAPSQLYAKRPRFNPPALRNPQQIAGQTSSTLNNAKEPSLHKEQENKINHDIGVDCKGERTKQDVLKLIAIGKDSASMRSTCDIKIKSDEFQNSSKDAGSVTNSKDQEYEREFQTSTSGKCSTATTQNASGTMRKSFTVPSRGFRSPLENPMAVCVGTPTISSPIIWQVDSYSTAGETSGEAEKEESVPVEDIRKPSLGKGPSTHQVKFQPPAGGRAPLTQKHGSGPQENTDEPKTYYYNVVWCKLSKKKHKKWEGDAIMKAKGRSVTLIDTEGKEIGRGSGYKVSELSSMSEGQTLTVGGKEIEMMSILKEEDFITGKCFQTATMVTNKAAAPRLKPAVVSKPFAKHQLSSNTQVRSPNPVIVHPKFDPDAPDALVMPRPNKYHEWEHNKQRLPVVDVVVDPHVAYHLRPHQRAGIIFLYECIMGMKDFTGQGAILADEMGLGKTLQCISLIWTLYKQGPYGGKPVIRRTLIIVPGSLVKNWEKEFRKWLGSERLKVFAVGSDNKTEDFARCTVYPVMVISYEMFIRNIDAVKAVKFDLVVCDEGHRLKNTNIKTTSFMMGLTTRRRIVLTGTPVQNDLKELFSIVEFSNPGVLGTSSAFHNVYEAPILVSRQPNATPAEEALGEMRAQELNRVTGMFILRRTQDINNKYLPPKVEVVLFCRPAELQLQLYRKLLSSRAVRSCLSSGDSAQHLMCIAAMKKICNCPSLLHQHAVEGAKDKGDNPYNTDPELYSGLLPVYPADYDPGRLALEHCGKLKVVSELLQVVHDTTPGQRIVLVSNFTQTLDVLERLCVAASYTFLRLDGQTPTGKRQQLIERFNSKHSDVFVFLLSSKAGGVGLNLVGATRLILYDIDWNPANDLQAMARIWRDGQQHRVCIYRLITTGSIEEKMYQRQISKQGLSGVVVDAKANSKLTFSPEELKDLFRLREDSLCCTHDLLGCDCTNQANQQTYRGENPGVRSCQLQLTKTVSTQKNLCMDELLQWRHEQGPAPKLSHVDPVLGDKRIDDVTYAFWNVSAQQQVT